MDILIDLEATCWKNEKYKQKTAEIIELSALAVDNNFEIAEIFSQRIKPAIEPELSEYCIKLTGIKQHCINNAKSFNEVLRAFDNWISIVKSYDKFIAWGNYDQILFNKNIKMYNYKGGGLSRIKVNTRFYNLQNKFEDIMYMNKGNCKLAKALSIIGETMEGREHNGFCDVRNMLKVYKFVCLFDNIWYIKENTALMERINEIRKSNFIALKR